jgi:pimeloyl-ACP methyl ester carboxylesterase
VLQLERFAVMVFDYGAPAGFRLAAANPSRISAIISQNGNAYEEGLQEDTWAPMRAYWETPTAANRDALRPFLTAEITRFQYTHGVPADKLDLVSPDAIAHDQAILDRDPELQLDLFGDYKSNVALYPMWQEYLRTAQPPVLAVWGNGDPFFRPAGAQAFRKDVPDAEVHLFDTGHFALETDGQEIATLIRDFLARKLGR